MFAFRAATINLNGRRDRWLARRHLLVGQLLDALPDIVALQEISLGIGQGTWLARQINIRLTGDARRPYHIVQARRGGWRHYGEGVGVLTRLPIIYHNTLDLGIDRHVALRVNLELPAGAAGSRHQSLDFVCVHLHHTAGERDARLNQAMGLVGWLNDRRRVPLQVIAGGFNDTPESPVVAFMRQSYRSAYAARHGRDPLATYPTGTGPAIRLAECLDYVFVSPAVYRVTEASVFCAKPAAEDDSLYPSDHVGLLVGLEV